MRIETSNESYTDFMTFKEVKKMLCNGRDVEIKKLEFGDNPPNGIFNSVGIFLRIDDIPDIYDDWIVKCGSIDVGGHLEPGAKIPEGFFRVLLIAPEDWEIIKKKNDMKSRNEE